MSDCATFSIAGITRNVSEVDESWVIQQINKRRHDGLRVCVSVTVKTTDVDVMLATPACGGLQGSARRLTSREQSLLDAWIAQRLNSSEFTGGNVVAFLKQVRRFC